MTMSELELRQHIIKLANQLLANQLIVRTWGNISARLDEHTMIITPSGKAYDSMEPEDLVKLSINDLKKIDASEPKPSSEAPMHAIAYRQRRDIHVVVHTHQIYASALSLSRREFAVKGEDAEIFKTRSIPISKYALPSTKKLHHNMQHTISSNTSRVILMQRHGAFILGEDFADALNNTQKLESFAKMTYQKMTGRHIHNRPSLDVNTEQENSLQGQGLSNMYISVSCDPELEHLQSKKLKPFLDDFAQIVGTEVSGKKKSASAVFSDKGPYVFCYGKSKEDADNVRAVLEKNVRATIIGEMYNRKPINPIECRLMREIYQRKYSKIQ